MAGAGHFSYSVVTPERVVAEGEARFVALPAWDGEIGVLRGRAPLLCKLDAGRLRIERADGESAVLFVDGGFAEVVGDRLTVLTESARRPEELEREAARAELEAARGMQVTDEASFEARQHALRKAREELRLLGSG